MQQAGDPLEGSAAEKRIQDIIARKASELGFATSRHPVSDGRSYHSFAESLRVVLPGADERTVSLIMPLNRPAQLSAQEHDPWLNPALALTLLESLARLDRPWTISCEFLGAEDGVERVGLGSRTLAAEPAMKDRLYGVYLNLGLNRQTLLVPQGADGRLSPAWLIDTVLNALEAQGQAVSARTVASQLHRLGLGRSNQLSPYLQANLPTAEITGLEGSEVLPPEQGNTALVAALGAILTDPDHRLAQSGQDAWDGNYLIFQFGDRHFILTEQSIVLGYLSTLVLFLVIIYFRRSIRQRYVRSLARQWAAIAAIIAAHWLVMLVASWLSGLLIPAWSTNPSYLYLMPWFLCGKLLLMAGLMLLASNRLKHFIKGASTFYGAAAFASALLMLVMISFYNITLSMYALVATLAVAMANLSRRRLSKLLYSLFAGAAFLVPLFDAVGQAPGKNLDHYLLRDPLISSFVFGLGLFPAIMLLARQWQLWPLHRPRFRLARRIGALAVTLCGPLVMALALIQFQVTGPQETRIELRRVVESDNRSERVMLLGSGPLPEGILAMPEGDLAVPGGGREFSHSQRRQNPVYLQTKTVTRRFLGRKSIELTIEPLPGLQKLSARLEADESLVIHALNFPHEYRDASHVDIFIGARPPLPLTLEILLPQELSCRLVIEASCYEPIVFRPAVGGLSELPCQTLLRKNLLLP